MAAPVKDRAAGPAATDPVARSLFRQVVVGVDASAESREAVRQVVHLMNGEGELELLAAYEVVYPAAVSGLGIVAYTDDYEKPYAEEAASALARAQEVAARDDAGAKVVGRRPADALLDEIERRQATLVAVGSHGHGRTAGILLGSVATEIVHRAPCSVLVARKAARRLPQTIVVGLDGSPESQAAYAVAVELARRADARLWPVVAHGGEPVDLDVVETLTTRHEDSPHDPVKALLGAASDADLLVVGSRGLHGLKALGSVSERVAHEAQCSTLVVRDPATGL
jgi:nucleotide-binding universal stress UspA family protein